MTRRPDKPATPPPSPPPVEPPSPYGSSEGMLDLDDHDQINNQHLEVR